MSLIEHDGDFYIMKHPITIPLQNADDILVPFAGLTLEHIGIPNNPAQFADAVADILACSVIGFDTESRPVFTKGEQGSGPHLIQFAAADRAYLFRVGMPGCIEATKAVLECAGVIKVGFGLKSDRSMLRSKLNIVPQNCIDLGALLRHDGRKGQVGARGAVASLLQQNLQKSRRISTSNWANPVLTPAQQLYAANDAYAALKVFQALGADKQAILLKSALFVAG